jgi:CRP-like cAMP-binding protein
MSELILPRTGILAFMDDESREQFAAYGNVLATTAGQVVIAEGQPNTSLYIVVSGTFNVTTQGSNSEVRLDIVGAGDCLGEVAVFQPGAASATATSVGEGQLWFIDVDNFQQFLIDYPFAGCAAILGVDTILSRRLKRANQIIRSNEILPTFLSCRKRAAVPAAK